MTKFLEETDIIDYSNQGIQIGVIMITKIFSAYDC